MKGSRILHWSIALFLAAPLTAQEIRYAEPIDLALGAATAQFDAYGRRFSLKLEDNRRLLQKLPAHHKASFARYRLVRGSIEGLPGSWVRLTESSGGIEGAIWDGHDLYAVTTHARAMPYLTTPLSAAPRKTIVYRLSDMRDALPADFCALGSESAPAAHATALDQYTAIVSDLQNDIAEAQIARQMEVSLIADAAFQAREPEDPVAAMLARFNIVEGIFSQQLGLLLLATDVRLTEAANDPFTSTNGNRLLEQLGEFRASQPAVKARGIAHLMTGKNLDGNTAGIAYVGSVCGIERGVSLSERNHGTTISALIMAHELGHNFGAPHDGAEGSACAAVQGSYIMSPAVTGYAAFSRCSIEQMRPVMDEARCVVPAEYADLRVNAAAQEVSGEGGLPFALPFTVRSVGNRPALDATLDVTLPVDPALEILSATASQGECAVSAGLIRCELGDIPPGGQATVEVVGRATRAMNFSVRARAEAANDRIGTNDAVTQAVTLRSGIDAALTLAGVDDVPLGAPVEIHADLSSLRSMPLVQAEVALQVNQQVTGASLPGATCTTGTYSVVCTGVDLASGASRRLTVNAVALNAGPLFAAAQVSVAGDGDLSNNGAQAQGWVQAERDVSLTAGPSSVELGVGAGYELPLVVQARGALPAEDSVLHIQLPGGALVVDSIDPGVASCTQPGGGAWRCVLGALAPGETRQVLLRVHGTAPMTGNIEAALDCADDQYAGNNAATVQVRVDHRVDLGVALAAGGVGVEDSMISGQVTLKAGGREAAIGASLDIRLHDAGVLHSAALHEGAPCTRVSDQLARCALPPVALGSKLFVDYRAEFAEPGTYDVTFTVNQPGDTAPDNDTLVREMIVRPYNDIALAGAPDLSALLSGESRDVQFTVSTDRRELATATFLAPHLASALRVESIAASSGDCRVDDTGGACDFTALPAGSSIGVNVRYLALAAVTGSTRVSVSTEGDVVPANDSLSAAVEVRALTDLELKVSGRVAGSSGATLDFPAITVVNGPARAYDAVLEIELPAGVSLAGISASQAICSGERILRCDFSSLEPFGSSTVNVRVRAGGSGSFKSPVRISASNDTNAANDSGEVTVDITATTSAPASKGGGGRLEWLALALLGWLGWCRVCKASVCTPGITGSQHVGVGDEGDVSAVG